MSIAKKKFKVGDTVQLIYPHPYNGGPYNVPVKLLKTAYGRNDGNWLIKFPDGHTDKFGSHWFAFVIPPKKRVKPKKPKPARVWKMSSGGADIELHINGKLKMYFGSNTEIINTLNAYERKIRRLEGR